MPDSVCAEDLREGLCVYKHGEPDRPGKVVSWCPGCSPDVTKVTVKWLGEPSTAMLLSDLKHFGRFVSDLRTKSDRYSQLLDELRQVPAVAPSAPEFDERRDCLTCCHKDLPIASHPCVTCKPVTGGAVNWKPWAKSQAQ